MRVKSGLFFTFVWPLLIAIGFGLILGGTADGPSAIAVAVADADGTAGSAAFIERLEGGGELAVRRTTAQEAIEAVRRGSRTAAILVEPGFGAASERAFFGSPPRLAAAMVSASVAFVGIMMLVAAIGRNEQSMSAAGWALMMPLSMIGGGMIPLFLMPAWLVQVAMSAR